MFSPLQVFSKLFLIYFLVYCLCAIVYYIAPMIDEKKLRTVRNYAKKKGFHRNWIYQLINKGAVTLVEIDGVKFVREDDK